MTRYQVAVGMSGQPQVGVTGRAEPRFSAATTGMAGPPGPPGPPGPRGIGLDGIQGTTTQLPAEGRFIGEAWITAPNGELWIWKELE